MKKILALLLAVVMVFGLAACGTGSSNEDKLTVGFIFLHDENSTYDKNFIVAAKEACENMDVKMVQKTQIPESEACYDAATVFDKQNGFGDFLNGLDFYLYFLLPDE